MVLDDEVDDHDDDDDDDDDEACGHVNPHCNIPSQISLPLHCTLSVKNDLINQSKNFLFLHKDAQPKPTQQCVQLHILKNISHVYEIKWAG